MKERERSENLIGQQIANTQSIIKGYTSENYRQHVALGKTLGFVNCIFISSEGLTRVLSTGHQAIYIWKGSFYFGRI